MIKKFLRFFGFTFIYITVMGLLFTLMISVITPLFAGFLIENLRLTFESGFYDKVCFYIIPLSIFSLVQLKLFFIIGKLIFKYVRDSFFEFKTLLNFKKKKENKDVSECDAR